MSLMSYAARNDRKPQRVVCRSDGFKKPLAQIAQSLYRGDRAVIVSRERSAKSVVQQVKSNWKRRLCQRRTPRSKLGKERKNEEQMVRDYGEIQGEAD
jgi:hypothetical protein